MFRLGLIACMLGGLFACAPVQNVTPKARSFLTQLGYVNPLISCQTEDTDLNSYISCTARDPSTAAPPIAFECSTRRNACRLSVDRD